MGPANRPYKWQLWIPRWRRVCPKACFIELSEVTPSGDPLVRRNPRVPTMEEFNPRIVEVLASDLSRLIVDGRHEVHPEQLECIATLADEELTRIRFDDPISATQTKRIVLDRRTSPHS